MFLLLERFPFLEVLWKWGLYTNSSGEKYATEVAYGPCCSAVGSFLHTPPLLRERTQLLVDKAHLHFTTFLVLVKYWLIVWFCGARICKETLGMLKSLGSTPPWSNVMFCWFVVFLSFQFNNCHFFLPWYRMKPVLCGIPNFQRGPNRRAAASKLLLFLKGMGEVNEITGDMRLFVFDLSQHSLFQRILVLFTVNWSVETVCMSIEFKFTAHWFWLLLYLKHLDSH